MSITEEDLQSIISIIHDWVLNQTESFTIADVYSRPCISEKLRHTKHSILLLTLGCTVDGGHSIDPARSGSPLYPAQGQAHEPGRFTVNQPPA